MKKCVFFSKIFGEKKEAIKDIIMGGQEVNGL